MKTSTIALALVHREGSASKQERSTFDYIIDGESLGTRLEIATLDFVGRLDAEHPHRNTEALASLVGDGAADIGADRMMLFVCPECGDLGCGAITTTVSARGDAITWSDFRYENNYDPTMTKRYDDVGPFHFDAATYRRALEPAR